MFKRTLVSLFGLLLLAGCGTTPEDRGISGAGIGAGAGAILGAVTGLSVLEGAAIGGLGGALTGVLTRPDQVNLGQPAWKQGVRDSSTTVAQSTPTVSTPAAAYHPTIAEVQQGLKRRGYDCGPLDGIYGPRTREAIRQYQRDHNLPVDGLATTELIEHMNAQGS